MDVVQVLINSLMILAIVFVLMVIIEYIELRTRGKAGKWMGRGLGRQYALSSFLGATPGCVGAFASVSLYIHGFLSLGAITACMIATSGDESFFMLAMFPKTALALFALLFVIGIVVGALTDLIAKKLHIKKCKRCKIKRHHMGRVQKITAKHYLKKHVVDHIIKKHVPKLFLWLFIPMLVLDLLPGLGSSIASIPTILLVLVAAAIGIIPESGPHLVFCTLFSEGLIGFPVLLTSSIVQDGHGMLPMLSYTVRDSVIVKIFNVFFGLAIGLFAAAIWAI